MQTLTVTLIRFPLRSFPVQFDNMEILISKEKSLFLKMTTGKKRNSKSSQIDVFSQDFVCETFGLLSLSSAHPDIESRLLNLEAMVPLSPPYSFCKETSPKTSSEYREFLEF